MICTHLSPSFSLATQAKTQEITENALNAGMSTREGILSIYFFFFLLCLRLCLGLRLQQLKTKYSLGIVQAQGYLPHVIMFRQ